MRILTEEDKQYIVDNLSTLYLNEITNNLNSIHNTDRYKYATIYHWVTHHGYADKYKREDLVFKEEDIQFIKDNYLNMSYIEMSKVLPYAEVQIRAKAEQLGLTKTRRFNNRYFEKIDTPLKAYFLGYIYADGWISTNGTSYEFGMTLQDQDKYVLEKLNEELGGKHIIKYEPPRKENILGRLCNCQASDTLRVYSKPLVMDLINQGISYNKSYSNIFPKVEEEFFFDYLRGYLDGDGSIYTDYVHHRKDAYLQIRIASLCKDNLDYLKERLSKYDIKTNVYRSHESKYDLVCYTIEDVQKLANEIYYSPDLFCLSRKRNKVSTLISNGSAA